MRSASRRWLTLVGVLLAAFFLRQFHLTTQPLRGDEAFTLKYWAALPLAESLTHIATIEPHPALTYITFHLWGQVIGLSAFSMRVLPALVSLLSLPALYRLGKSLGGHAAGLSALLLWAVQPYALWHAQDARNYALWSGLSAVALWLAWHTLHHPRPRNWLLYALWATVAANSFYNEWFMLAALLLVAGCAFPRQFKLLALAQLPAWLTSLLSFALLQGRLLANGGYGGTGINFELSQLPNFLVTLIFGKTIPPAYILPLTALIITFFSLGLVCLRHRPRWLIFIGVTSLFPLVALCALSLRLRIFAPHYVLAAAPLFTLAVVALWQRLPRRPLGLRSAFLAAIILPTLLALADYYFNPASRKAPNWPLLTAYLNVRAQPDDLIIQQSIDPAFGYYNAAPSDELARPTSPAQSSESIAADLLDYTKRYQTLWLVGQPYPDWPNQAVVETWLKAHQQLGFDEWADGLHLQAYTAWDYPALPTDNRPTFGDVAALVNVQFIPPILPANPYTLWLDWQPLGTSPAPLKVFLHLVDAQNPHAATHLWSQDDQFPQNGRLSTAAWQPNVRYRDVYQLPLSAIPAGEYALLVGFYDPSTNQRLTTAEGDSVVIGTITLPP